MKNKIIEIKEVSINYGKINVLENISFSVSEGDYIGVVGPNGSGKTTLMKALIGLKSIESGTVDINPKTKLGYLPQNRPGINNLFPATVREIILSGRMSNGKLINFYKKSDHEAVDTILEKLGIYSIAEKRIGEISGGQHQRVLLARALVSNPDMLILDEPTSALDPTIRSEFYSLITEINQKDKVTILLVTHDISTIGKRAKKILYLDKRLVFFGTFEEFCHSSKMTEYFGYPTQHMICGREHHE